MEEQILRNSDVLGATFLNRKLASGNQTVAWLGNTLIITKKDFHLSLRPDDLSLSLDHRNACTHAHSTETVSLGEFGVPAV